MFVKDNFDDESLESEKKVKRKCKSTKRKAKKVEIAKPIHPTNTDTISIAKKNTKRKKVKLSIEIYDKPAAPLSAVGVESNCKLFTNNQLLFLAEHEEAMQTKEQNDNIANPNNPFHEQCVDMSAPLSTKYSEMPLNDVFPLSPSFQYSERSLLYSPLEMHAFLF
jgi:hypothetical protein